MAKTLLEIDSSPLGDRSLSRHLTHEFVEQWKAANSDSQVVTRDLNATDLAPITAAWIGASYTPEDKQTPEQQKLLATSNALIDELKAADAIVIGVPMHNFSVPSVLKLWIDQIARAGKTFSYATGTPQGLLTNKKATVFITSGGKYDAGTALASMNFVEPYLRAVLAFLGITDVTFITASGASAVATGKVDRQAFLEPHIASIRAQFQPAA